eukprot:scaffold13280_cov114-Isochrysis_galbana.AAC.4
MLCGSDREAAACAARRCDPVEGVPAAPSLAQDTVTREGGGAGRFGQCGTGGGRWRGLFPHGGWLALGFYPPPGPAPPPTRGCLYPHGLSTPPPGPHRHPRTATATQAKNATI